MSNTDYIEVTDENVVHIVNVQRIEVDPDPTKNVQGPTVRFDPVGCPCGTCGSQAFLYVSDGETLLTVALDAEQVAFIQQGITDGFMLGGNLNPLS